KFQPYGYVVVDERTGEILMERRQLKLDEPGAKPIEAQLRPRADAFVRSRAFPGAPSPQFESARPNVMSSRTDWTFRYRVHSDLPIGKVVPYLQVYFTGDTLAGWALIEEYSDGSPFRNESAGEAISSLVARFATSYARERWGERLASFDSILRRDPLNATAGRSVIDGVLFAPAVAAAALIAALIPLVLGIAHISEGTGTSAQVQLGGPFAVLLFATLDAIVYPILALFLLAWTHRRRVLWVGVIAVIAIGMVGAVCQAPIDPFLQCLLFGFGGIGVVVAIFLGYDLLTTAIALFGGSLIAMTAPLMSVAHGHELSQLVLLNALPLGAAIVFGAAAMMTKREVVYKYEDLAPHVKRIVERERVKAEIDAANRIQAALLPQEAPYVAGASVASHYRAATEIGGDYFDFLPQPNGDVGIAFGDVSGHGLTSGIVMAMAKSALLVQVGYDSSPRAVMNVLNSIVMRTAPKRTLMTFFFGLLDPASQTLRFSSAG